MTQEHHILHSSVFERYRKIQRVCDNLLIRLEEHFNQNLIFDDIKELSKLDMVLKLRTKLLELEQEIQESKALNMHHENRQDLIEGLIQKIKKSIPPSRES